MIWVMAIYCTNGNCSGWEPIPQYHRIFSTFEDCQDFYKTERHLYNFIFFLPIAGPSYSDFVDEFDVVKGDHWKKFYDKALPETMTLDELREYWYDY